MELLLIRHTTPAVKKGICYGQLDVDVIDRFQEEIELVKKRIPLSIEWNDVPVFSSPLQRCSKLSNSLFGNRTHLDDRLKEMNFGDWEGKQWNDIPRELMDAWAESFDKTPCPNGESFGQMHSRVINFIEEQKKKYSKVICVTHAGVMRAAWCYSLNKPLMKAFDVTLEYGDVLHLKW